MERKFSEPLKVMVTPDMKKTIGTMAKTSGKSEAQIAREVIGRGLQVDIMEDSKDVIREVVREEIKRELAPAVDRLAKICVKAFIAAETSRILNREALYQSLYDDTISESDNLQYIHDLNEKARIEAVRNLRTKE